MWLRQGTARAIHIGPAIASGGFTTVTTLTATNVTALKILKSSATVAVTVTGRTFTHIADGHYRLSLLSTDTNTLGHLTVYWRASGSAVKSLPVWERFEVVPTQVYDSLATGGDKLQVDATQWAGQATATGDVAIKNTLAKTTDITGFNDIAAADVWAAAARTLTSAAVVWTAAARGLTSKVGYALTTGQHDAIGARTWQTTVTEIGAVPAASPAAASALQFVYVASRNKRITTATGDKIHNSATTVIATAPLSASTTTFEKGKYV